MESSLTDEELEAPLDAATEATISRALAEAKDPEPENVAESAHFDAHNGLLLIKLQSGKRLAIPKEDLQGLADATDADAALIDIDPLGLGLHWEKLDADHLVQDLREGYYGNRHWMAALEKRWKELRKAS
jgi:hypothetical protein